MSEDLELARRWRDGDRRAGEVLFERHYDAIECFFRNKVSTGIEDLLQKTFLICVEKKDDFRGESSFRTYLFGVAYNVLRNHYRQAKRQRERIDFQRESVADLAPGVSTMVRGSEQRSLLLAALRSIPLDYQVVLELYYWEEMEGKAIAEVLGIPDGTARSRIRLGKERLRKALEEQELSPERLRETLTHLDEWARELRARLVRDPLE